MVLSSDLYHRQSPAPHLNSDLEHSLLNSKDFDVSKSPNKLDQDLDNILNDVAKY